MVELDCGILKVPGLQNRVRNLLSSGFLMPRDRHLAEMSKGLAGALSNWRARLEPVLAAEEALFGRFVSVVEAELDGPVSRS